MSDICVYAWRGITKNGKRLSSTIKAESVADAIKALQKQGITIVTITLTARTAKRVKLKPAQAASFMQQLATLINANIPILKCLDIIGHDNSNPHLRAIVASIKRGVENGSTLNAALKQHPKHFSSLWCSLISLGENSGTLDVMLAHIAKYIFASFSQKQRLLKALLYPAVVLVIAGAVSGILLIFVIPRFQEIFANAGAALPGYTRFILALAHGVRSYGLLALICLAALVTASIMAINRSPELTRKRDALVLRIPIYGEMVRKSIIAHYARTLGITLKSGMPLLQGITLVQDIIKNTIYKQSAVDLYKAISSGNSLSFAMRKQQLFPERVLQLIAIGEETGKLDDMLFEIVHFYEANINHCIDTLNSLFEPILILVLGIIVGGLVIGMYLPIFRLGNVL